MELCFNAHGFGFKVFFACSIGSLVILYKEKKDYVRFEVFTAVTMKNVDFWDIKTQFVPHRRHITCPLQSPAI
jgi:hypothetical protein